MLYKSNLDNAILKIHFAYHTEVDWKQVLNVVVVWKVDVHDQHVQHQIMISFYPLPTRVVLFLMGVNSISFVDLFLTNTNTNIGVRKMKILIIQEVFSILDANGLFDNFTRSECEK